MQAVGGGLSCLASLISDKHIRLRIHNDVLYKKVKGKGACSC